MNTLASLQRSVQGFLREGGAPPPAVTALVAPPGEERWTIYRDAYRIRLVEALSAAFPGLAARLGDDFGRAVIGYVLETPSTFRSLRDYGAGLPEWFAAQVADGAGDDADHGTDDGVAGLEGRLRAELATLDRALGDAFDAADVPPLGLDALATVTPEDWAALCFGFVPGCVLLTLTTNAAEVRAAPELAAAEQAPGARLVWRHGEECRHRALDADEADALAAAQAGSPFATLCETLHAHHGEGAPLRAAALLRRWIDDGLVATARVG